MTSLKQAWEEGFHALDDAINPYDEDTEGETDTIGLFVVWLIIILVIVGAIVAGYFDLWAVE